MLIITRRISESLIIGDDIEVHILGEKDQVRNGIDASQDVTVHREEIYQRIQTQKKMTAKVIKATDDSLCSGLVEFKKSQVFN